KRHRRGHSPVGHRRHRTDRFYRGRQRRLAHCPGRARAHGAKYPSAVARRPRLRTADRPMTQTASTPVILWDHFAPGTLLGECTETYDAAQASRWQTLFGRHTSEGAGGYAEQAGMATIMMMRAFLHTVAPRPPGNIHAG